MVAIEVLVLEGATGAGAVRQKSNVTVLEVFGIGTLHFSSANVEPSS